MITLEQIRRLEKRVHNAVATISALKGENALLKQKLAGYETRITELEAKLVEFKDSQSEIERGLLSALDQLDALEDEILEDPSPQTEGDQEEFAVSPSGTEQGSVAETSESGNDETAPDDQQATDELDIF